MIQSSLSDKQIFWKALKWWIEGLSLHQITQTNIGKSINLSRLLRKKREGRGQRRPRHRSVSLTGCCQGRFSSIMSCVLSYNKPMERNLKKSVMDPSAQPPPRNRTPVSALCTIDEEFRRGNTVSWQTVGLAGLRGAYVRYFYIQRWSSYVTRLVFSLK